MDDPEGPPSRQAARTRGYQRISHPILGVCLGQLTDTWYKGLQQGHLAVGHTDNLFQGTSHGWVQNYQ